MSRNYDILEDFYSGSSNTSYAGRMRSRREIENLSKKIAYNHAYRPANASTLSQFLRLKQEDSHVKTTVAPSLYSSNSSGGSSWANKLMDDESAKLLSELQAQASAQFIQNFYNAYMSPANSDICYRLGTVTRAKHSSGLYDEKGNPVQSSGSVIYNSNGQLSTTNKNTCEVLGQTDRFGRIDTVSNLRVKIDIAPSSVKSHGMPITPGYSEYYVNWFFPPFNSSVFDLDAIQKAQLAATRAEANKSFGVSVSNAVSEVEKARSVAWDKANLTKKSGLAADKSLVPTYDPIDMMCSRDGFTYRTAGYKAINDNITFLQHIFEECSGVVSTYLTDWDLSLYIQEGLLTTHSSGNIWLCNRMEEDNPQGLTGDDAFNWGVINAAVSKLPVNGVSSCEAYWNPQAFHLSAYWWPYPSSDRGDGLASYWNNATASRDDARNVKLTKTFCGKVKYEDYIHAAYAGWVNFDNMKYYQALYTTSDDGLSAVDIVHAQESNYPEEPFDSLQNEIRAVQDALYADDDSLGWKTSVTTEYAPGPTPAATYETPRNAPGSGAMYNRIVKHYVVVDPYDSDSRTLDYQDYYYGDRYVTTADAHGNHIGKGANDVRIDGEGNISILGAEIPGSSLLKIFLKRNKHKKAALGIAAKSKEGFGNIGDAANKSSGGSGGSKSPSAMGDLFNPSEDENGRFSNPLGIPRLGPALFGGPHGAYASPQTMQAYFDPENPFLQSIARINPSIRVATNNFTSNNKAAYYDGVEVSYMYPAGREGDFRCYIGRSPSETLHLLTSGVCEVERSARINVYKKFFEDIKDNGSPSVSVSKVTGGYGRYGYGGGGTRYHVNVTAWHFPSTRGHYSKQDGYNPYPISYSGSPVMRSSTQTVNTGVKAPNNAVCSAGAGVRRAYVSGGYIYAEYYNKYWAGEYYDYSAETYNRPLLHCIPYYGKDHVGDQSYSHWQMAKYSAALDPDVKYSDGTLSQYLAAWGANEETKYASEYMELKKIMSETPASNEKYFRLTMPYYGDNYKNNSSSGMAGWVETKNEKECGGKPSAPTEHKTWTDRYKPEEELVKYMIQNAGSPGSNKWTDLFYCYSDPSDSASARKNTGPRALLRIPTRLQKRKATYNSIYYVCTNYRHKPKCKPCHEDWAICTTPDVETTYTFIECNPDFTKSFWASANWSDKYTPNLVNKDIMADIPSEKYRVRVANSVWELMHPGKAPKQFRFAGKGFTEKDSGNDGGQYLSGWGIYSALPGFGTIPGQSSFEDANKVLCLAQQGTLNKDTPLINYTFTVPLFNSAGGAVRDSNGEYFYNPLSANNQPTYVTGSMGTYDPGMQNFLKHMYTSCTLFVPETKSITAKVTPFTTDISNCLISALKLVQHQRAYLEFGRELFKNSVEPSEVIRIIDRCVDPNVRYASIHGNTSSIYYNYWIQKAYNLYSNSNAQSTVASKFSLRIGQIDAFIKRAEDFMKLTANNDINQVTAMNWSYNNYLECYNVFDSFRSICSGLDTTIEEYFFAYLNVLYEYRRFYINKRCNKQDGTLWICRAFESVIPMLNGSASESATDLGAIVESASAAINSYSITMKMLSNNVFDKGYAIAKESGLEKDRIIRLLMPCVQVTEKEWDKFIKGESNKEIIRVNKADPNRKGIFGYVYIEKPQDGTYQLIASEYLKNKQNKDYNEILVGLKNEGSITEASYKEKLREVDTEIEDCIFPIVWLSNSSSATLQAYLDAAQDLKEATANQNDKKRIYAIEQKKYVDLLSEVAEKRKAQETVVENWKTSLDYASQCITAYSDYAEPYFYVDRKGVTAEYMTLKRMAALRGVLDHIGDSEYATAVTSYKNAFSLNSTEVDRDLSEKFNAINFDSKPEIYSHFADSLHSTDSENRETIEVLGTPRETFLANISEIFSWVNQYVEAKDNVKKYEASYKNAKKVLDKIEQDTDAELATQNGVVSKAKAEYDESVLKFKTASDDYNKTYDTYVKSKSKVSQDQKEAKYTWIAPSKNNDVVPTIIFNQISGIDLSKIDPNDMSTPEVAVCSSGNFVDYWCITLPNPPVDKGYDTRLKIKTYESEIRDANSFTANMATTVAGAFAYSLYPITEDQQGAIASIGASLTDAEAMIRNTYS